MVQKTFPKSRKRLCLYRRGERGGIWGMCVFLCTTTTTTGTVGLDESMQHILWRQTVFSTAMRGADVDILCCHFLWLNAGNRSIIVLCGWLQADCRWCYCILYLLKSSLSPLYSFISLPQSLALINTTQSFFLFYSFYLDDSPWVANSRCCARPSAAFPSWHQRIAAVRGKSLEALRKCQLSLRQEESCCVLGLRILVVVQWPERLSSGPWVRYTCSIQQAFAKNTITKENRRHHNTIAFILTGLKLRLMLLFKVQCQ